MKMLFYGFRHEHILGLFKYAKQHEKIKIIACIEDCESERIHLEKHENIEFDLATSYEEWLDKDVDIVALGGAYGDRGFAAIKALRAGKHLILDKPICIDERHFVQIKKLVNEKGLKIACMFDLRYMPFARCVKHLMESGEIGEVKNVSFTGQHFLNYGVRPRWYFEEGMHGGTLNDLAIHGVDLIQYLTGLTFRKIHAARVWNSFAKQEPSFKDSAMFMAELENGAGVIADVSYSAPKQVYKTDIYWNFKFWCENGLITFSYAFDKVKVYLMNEEEPREYICAQESGNYLDDLIDEIENNTNELTQSVLKSTEIALRLQSFAEKDER